MWREVSVAPLEARAQAGSENSGGAQNTSADLGVSVIRAPAGCLGHRRPGVLRVSSRPASTHPPPTLLSSPPPHTPLSTPSPPPPSFFRQCFFQEHGSRLDSPYASHAVSRPVF